MGPIRCPETSVYNYHTMQRNTPKDRICYLNFVHVVYLCRILTINNVCFRLGALCSVCKFQTESLYIISINFNLQCSVLWLRRLVCGLSPWRRRFDHLPVHARFVLDSMTLVFLLIHCFSLVSVIPPMLHTHLYHNVRLSEGQRAKSNNIQAKQSFFWNWGAWDGKLL
jgi:hypothetical protein